MSDLWSSTLWQAYSFQAVLGPAPETALRFLTHHDGGPVDVDLAVVYDQIGLPADVLVERSVNDGSSWSTVISSLPLQERMEDLHDTGFTFDVTNLYRVTVSAGATPVAIFTDSVVPVTIPPPTQAWRYIAQNLVTGAWLHWNVPLTGVQITKSLNAPDAITGTLEDSAQGDTPVKWADVLTEWQTVIYAEEESTIRAAGIVTAFQAGQVTCTGFPGYAKDEPYLAAYSKDTVDPLDVVREIWRYLQAKTTPTGNIGLEVDATTSPVRIGKTTAHLPQLTDDQSQVATGEAYALNWWEAKDCSDEIDQLRNETPFDYAEDHSWNGTRVVHRLILGYPRIGKQRTDLRFAVGENVSVLPEPDRDGDEYANVSYGIGKGEGQAALHVEYPIDDGRLRRTNVWTNALVSDQARLTALAMQDVNVRSQLFTVDQVSVKDHPNAPLGSFQPGDDILLRAVLPWHGDVAEWFRITSYTINPEVKETAVLALSRSDSFTYGEAPTIQTVNPTFS